MVKKNKKRLKKHHKSATSLKLKKKHKAEKLDNQSKEESTIRSIFDVKLSKKQEKLIKRKKSDIRVPTGLPDLDKLIQGGYKEGSINLVEGGPGSGKTIFSTQFLVEGIKRGEPTAYITFEVVTEKFYENMLMLGWDLEKYEKEGLFTFLAYTPEQIKRIIIEGGGTIDALITKRKIKRLVIDSITSFALLYPTELAKKEAALTLFSVIDTWDCTALLTAQAEGDNQGEMISAALDFEVDSIIILYHIKKHGKRKRGIEILKMRGTKIPDKIFYIEITKGGLKVLSKEFEV